jgi:predicted TIM-barrel fold metal-dependent hydrolase
VDAHTHIFPPHILENREAIRERDVWFGELYANPKALLATADDILASMDRASINVSIACGFPWRDSGLCADHNAYLAASAEASGGRIAWLATVLPGHDSAPGEAERAFGLGAVGLGELNADAQAFRIDDPKSMSALAEVCIAFDRPIMFHVSEPVGHVYPGKGTATPDRLLALLAAFPALRVVAAHWGGGLPFYELMPEVADLARNVVYDSAASTYLYRFGVFRSVIDIVGRERVLMGTDYPLLRQDRFLRRIAGAGMRHEELPAVMGGNAVRFFRLDDRGVAP